MKKLCEKKRNNKGFSLVELIVVILIMAVIAVALAPQVMKWVGKSKDSADQSNLGQIESAVSAGVADYMAANGSTIPSAPRTYFIAKNSENVGNGLTKTKGGTAITDTEMDALEKCIKEVMNGKYPTPQADKSQTFKIVITETGGVTVTVTSD